MTSVLCCLPAIAQHHWLVTAMRLAVISARCLRPSRRTTAIELATGARSCDVRSWYQQSSLFVRTSLRKTRRLSAGILS